MLVARDLWVAPPGAPAEPVLRGLSLEVRGGEWLAITGPNGGGKSTLLLALSGLAPPSRGSVELDGETLSPGAAARSSVALVLQDLPSQLLQPTVAEEIGFGPRNLGWSEGEVASAVGSACRRLGLAGLEERDPRTLSAGFQQLTMLAAGLAARPRVLLVDEGGAHLDRSSRERVLEILHEEVAGGMSLVWVTQEPTEIEAAGRVLWLDAGVGRPGAEVTPSRGNWPDRSGFANVESAPVVPGPGQRPAVPKGPPIRARVVITPARPGEIEAGPRVEIASRLEWECEAAGVISVEGPNGSGKSTLLSALAGLIRSPQVLIEWKTASCPGPLLASQHPEEQIFAETVEEEVLFAATQRGSGWSETIRAAMFHFEALKMGSTFMRRRAWGLSTGEKRIVQVVATLISPASITLLDEPLSGLDPERRKILATLIEKRARDVPVVVSGHDRGRISPLEITRIKLGSELASPSKKTD